MLVSVESTQDAIKFSRARVYGTNDSTVQICVIETVNVICMKSLFLFATFLLSAPARREAQIFVLKVKRYSEQLLRYIGNNN